MDKNKVEVSPKDELNASLIYYFSCAPDFDRWSTPWEDISNLIQTGQRYEWMHNSTHRLISQLSEKQKKFVEALYALIVNHSDVLQFLELDDDEQIIADYIRREFPWRDGLWFFHDKVNQKVSDRLDNKNTIHNS